MVEMKFHPVCELFPAMQEKEFEALVSDIAQNGLREPIHVLGQSIIDGRHRYRACQATGVEPRFVEVADNADLYGLVISLNLHRRHLSESQRAMIAARLESYSHGGQRLTGQDANLHLARIDAAQMFNVSPRSVASAARVNNEGIHELAHAVDQGRVSVSAASDIARLPAEVQREVLSRTPEEIRAFAREFSHRIHKAGVVGPSAARIFDQLAQENALSGIEQVAIVEQLKADGPVLPTPAEAQRLAIAGEPGLLVLGSDNRYHAAPGDPEKNALYERWQLLRTGLESLGTLPFPPAQAFASIPAYQNKNVTTWLSHAVPFLNQLNTFWSDRHAQS